MKRTKWSACLAAMILAMSLCAGSVFAAEKEPVLEEIPDEPIPVCTEHLLGKVSAEEGLEEIPDEPIPVCTEHLLGKAAPSEEEKEGTVLQSAKATVELLALGAEVAMEAVQGA